MTQEVHQKQNNDDDLFEIDLFGLMNAVLKRIKMCAAICTVAIALGLVYCYTATPVYMASSRMLVEPGSLKVTQIQGVYDSEFGRDSNSRRDFINTQMKLMTSDNLLAKVYEHFELSKREDFAQITEPLKAVADRIVVAQVPNTSLIDVGFKDPDPEFSAAVANYIASIYIEDSVARATGFSQRGLEKLTDELVNMERERFKAIEKLNTFKSSHNMLSAETATNLLVSKLTALGSALVTAKQEVANAEAAVQAVDTWKKLGYRLDSIPQAIANTTLSNFKVARLQAQGALVKSLQDFGPNHKTVLTQRRVIAEMDKAIEHETENSLISINARLQEARVRLSLLEKENEEATNELKALDQITDEYKLLEDNLKAAEKAYQFVLERVSELKIAKSADSGSGGTFQVIVPATPPQKAAYPQKAKIMVILALAAAVVSVLICILLELLDRTLKRREDFESAVGKPVFGEIPFAKGDRADFVCLDDPKGAVAEAFRALRTSISLSHSVRRCKLLAITSAMLGEGKTFVSHSLAVTYARAGKRVLLVDADLRRRRLTQMLNGQNMDAAGLSSILAGVAGNECMVKPVADLPITLLPAGPQAPNPVELLSSDRAQEVFAEFARDYDIVIIDTAPVLLVSDTPNLAAIEGLQFMIVGRLNKTERNHVDNVMREFNSVHATVAGAVIKYGEGDKGAGLSNDRYGYGYGYGYGADESKK